MNDCELDSSWHSHAFTSWRTDGSYIPRGKPRAPALAKRISRLDEWVRCVRHSPGSAEEDTPAAKLVKFQDGSFLRMSCGGLLLDYAPARAQSSMLTPDGPVKDEVALVYMCIVLEEWRFPVGVDGEIVGELNPIRAPCVDSRDRGSLH